MIPLKSKATSLKKRMQQLKPTDRYYFVKGETNIRFCHIEENIMGEDELKYLVFPFCDEISLLTAAQLLKDCGIVDGYKEIKLDESNFYVELIEYKYKQHTDANGKTMGFRVRKVKEWNDIKLTQSDCKQFIARFELARPVFDLTPKTPVIQMPIRQTITKRIA